MQPSTSTNSFGRLVASSETVENPYLFTGRPLDPVTGLYYFRAREYDPSLGRFLSPDLPVFARSGNLYAYAENKPLDFTDPVGYFLIGIGLEEAPLGAVPQRGVQVRGRRLCVWKPRQQLVRVLLRDRGALYAGIGEGGAASGSVVLHVSPFGDIEHFNGRSHKHYDHRQVHRWRVSKLRLPGFGTGRHDLGANQSRLLTVLSALASESGRERRAPRCTDKATPR